MKVRGLSPLLLVLAGLFLLWTATTGTLGITLAAIFTPSQVVS